MSPSDIIDFVITAGIFLVSAVGAVVALSLSIGLVRYVIGRLRRLRKPALPRSPMSPD